MAKIIEITETGTPRWRDNTCHGCPNHCTRAGVRHHFESAVTVGQGVTSPGGENQTVTQVGPCSRFGGHCTKTKPATQ